MDGTQASPPVTQGFRPGQLGSLPGPPPIDLQVQATAAASIPGTEASRPGHQTGTAPFPLDSYTPQVSRTGSSASAPGSDGVSPRLTRLDQLPHPLDSESRRRQQLQYPAPRPRGPATRLALLPSPALVHHKSRGRGLRYIHPAPEALATATRQSTDYPPTRLKVPATARSTASAHGSPGGVSPPRLLAHLHRPPLRHQYKSGRTGSTAEKAPGSTGKKSPFPPPNRDTPPDTRPHSAENGPSSIGSDESYADPRRCRTPSPSPSSQLSEPSGRSPENGPSSTGSKCPSRTIAGAALRPQSSTPYNRRLA